MEPTRPKVCAIMSLRRAAHLQRYTDRVRRLRITEADAGVSKDRLARRGLLLALTWLSKERSFGQYRM